MSRKTQVTTARPIDVIEQDASLSALDRLAEVRAMGHVPDAVGPDVPIAPARGPVRMFEGRGMVRTEGGGLARMRTGHMGRKTLTRADSFDVIEAKARAAHARAMQRAEAQGKPVPVYQEPFNAGQVAMGRFYRDLVEKHACAGVKCSSIEGRTGGSSGSGSDFMDAVLRDRDRIDQLRARIGSGSALVVRRNRPSARGSRVGIMDRRLVDIVCLEDGTLSDVLERHGWAKNARLIGDLQVALRAVLDRMMGPVQRSGQHVVRFEAGCAPVWG